MSAGESPIEKQPVPPYLLLDVSQIDPARYTELLVQLGDIPHRPVSKALAEAVGRLTVPSPEIGHEPDFVSKQTLVDFAAQTMESKAAAQSIGKTWNGLRRQTKWARWALEEQPSLAAAEPGIEFMAALITELPSDKGLQTLLDAKALYNYFLVTIPLGRTITGLRLGEISTNRLIGFIEGRYGVSLARVKTP